METDVDAYFAKHDIPSVISDMLFELGFHRPKDVGKFMAAYVERRFHLADASGNAADKRGGGPGDGAVCDEDFSTIQVHTPARNVSQAAAPNDTQACALLEEVRALGRKYRDFRPQPAPAGDGGAASMRATEGEMSSITIIPWKEFRLDLDRLLVIFSKPVLWTFCERRLAALRGFFDAHVALNAAAEEVEVARGGPEERADPCVQLASSLSPHRLLGFVRRKAKEDTSKEVAPGKTLTELTEALNRPLMPKDLIADPDMLVQPSALELTGVFSRTSNHIRGQYLAEAVREGFDLLNATNSSSGGTMYADYRLPLHPESGAWVDLARWVNEFNVESPRARWVIQLSQAAYSGLKERRSVLNFGELLENAFGPPAATSNVDAAGGSEAGQLAMLLKAVSGFELASIPGISEEYQATDLEREPLDWTVTANPPYSYQLYHMWARLKALNWVRDEAGLPPLDLRCATSTAEPLACAYLLGANGTSRCASLAAHSPLQYLFALELDDLTVSVSLSSKRSLNGTASEEGPKVLSKLFRAGVATALCTEDPTISQQADNALTAEYCLARNSLGLQEADLAELARNSMAASGFRNLPRGGVGEEAGKQPARTIRQRYRTARRDAELKLIAAYAQQSSVGRGSAEDPQPTVSFT